MPKVTTYIRQEDYEKWKATDNKSELIHRALNGLTDAVVEQLTRTMDKTSQAAAAKLARPDLEFCKHDAVLGFCRKGCK